MILLVDNNRTAFFRPHPTLPYVRLKNPAGRAQKKIYMFHNFQFHFCQVIIQYVLIKAEAISGILLASQALPNVHALVRISHGA